MTEKCFEERFRDVEENYKVITNRIAEAAVRSGRKPEDITFLAATKTGRKYEKYFGPQCEKCGSRMICNGCARCGKCTVLEGK